MPPAAPTGPERDRRDRLDRARLDREHGADLAGYNVYRSTSDAGTAPPARRSTARRCSRPRRYTDTTATAGTTYHYVVTAVDFAEQRVARLDRAPRPQASGSGPNQALQLNGTSQYVTFGAAPALNARTSRSSCGSSAPAPASGTSTGTGGIASAIPLITKGRAEAETPANLNMDYFLGIDASSGVLVADFEDTANGTNHPVIGHDRRDQQRLAPRRGRLRHGDRHLEPVPRRRRSTARSPWAATSRPSRRASSTPPSAARSPATARPPASSRAPSTRSGSGTSPARTAQIQASQDQELTVRNRPDRPLRPERGRRRDRRLERRGRAVGNARGRARPGRAGHRSAAAAPAERAAVGRRSSAPADAATATAPRSRSRPRAPTPTRPR